MLRFQTCVDSRNILDNVLVFHAVMHELSTSDEHAAAALLFDKFVCKCTLWPTNVFRQLDAMLAEYLSCTQSRDSS